MNTQREQRWEHVRKMELPLPLAGTIYFQRFLGERAYPSDAVLPPSCDTIEIQAFQFSPFISTHGNKMLCEVSCQRIIVPQRGLPTGEEELQ